MIFYGIICIVASLANLLFIYDKMDKNVWSGVSLGFSFGIGVAIILREIMK